MKHHLLRKVFFLFSLVTFLFILGCEKETDSATNTGTGSGSGSGSGSGGATTGNAMFWIASDLGCGSINVSINGQSKTISSFYSTSPSCGASGCANFTLAPGTYNYSASCSGKTWSNTITVTAGGCSKMQLTSSNNSGGSSGGGSGGSSGGGSGGSSGGGSGGSSGGSSGGGSGGSNITCTNMNSYVTATGTWINNCGNGNNDLSVRVTNNGSKALYIRIIIKKKTGAFDCGGVFVAPGSYGTFYSCNASDYRFQAILESEYGNNCMGDCKF